MHDACAPSARCLLQKPQLLQLSICPAHFALLYLHLISAFHLPTVRIFLPVRTVTHTISCRSAFVSTAEGLSLGRPCDWRKPRTVGAAASLLHEACIFILEIKVAYELRKQDGYQVSEMQTLSRLMAGFWRGVCLHLGLRLDEGGLVT